MTRHSLLLVLVLAVLSARADDDHSSEEIGDVDGDGRTLGHLFKNRQRYGYPRPPTSGGLFGGILSSIFGGGGYNPYFNPYNDPGFYNGYGYPNGYNPYYGGGRPGFGPGYGGGYGPGFGGYQQFPGGYGGFRNTRNTKLSKDLDININ